MRKLPLLLILLLALAGCSGPGQVRPTEPAASPVLPADSPAPATPQESPSPAPAESASARPASTPTPAPVPTPAPSPTPEPEAEGPTDGEVLAAYGLATEAYHWFVMGPPELDRTDQRTVGELTYCRVDDPRFSTLAELRGYLKTLFSDTLVDQLLPIDGTQYVELDGALYTVDGGRGADITKGEETVEILRDEAPARYTVRVTVEVLDPEQDFAVTGRETHDFLYEEVGGRWIFTAFSAVR